MLKSAHLLFRGENHDCSISNFIFCRHRCIFVFQKENRRKPNREKKQKKAMIWSSAIAFVGLAGIFSVIFPDNEKANVAKQEAVTIEKTTEQTVAPAKKEQKNTTTQPTKAKKSPQPLGASMRADNPLRLDIRAIPMMNGPRTKKLGEYSVTKALSADVTTENLTDWYFNFVDKSDFNYYIIVYTENNNLGVIASNFGNITKNVGIIRDQNGDYEYEKLESSLLYAADSESMSLVLIGD